MLLLAGALAVATIAAIPATASIFLQGQRTAPSSGPRAAPAWRPTASPAGTELREADAPRRLRFDASAFTFCNSSTVGGAISVATSTGFILIGDGGEGTCAGGHIDGAVTLDSNSGGVELGGNTIGGAVKVTANVAPTSGIPVEDAATEIEGNSIGGTLTCSNNNPVPTNDMKPNTVSSTRTGETCASSTF